MRRDENKRPILCEAKPETIAKIARVLSRISMRNYVYPLEVRTHPAGLVIITNAKCRNSGVIREFWHYAGGVLSWKATDFDDLETDDEIIDLIVQKIKDVAAHEVDECFMVDGKIRKDPHR